jgi:hypothetical protein
VMSFLRIELNVARLKSIKRTDHSHPRDSNQRFTIRGPRGQYLSIYQRICCLPFIIQLVQQYASADTGSPAQDDLYVANPFLLPNNLARQ